MSTPGSSLRERILQKMRDSHDVDENKIAEGLAHVIKGERVLDKYAVIHKDDGTTEQRHVERSITRTPKDMALGAMVWDSMTGGELGLAPRLVRNPGNTAVEAMQQKWLPEVDSRIISNEAVKNEVIGVDQVMEKVATAQPDNDHEPF